MKIKSLEIDKYKSILLITVNYLVWKHNIPINLDIMSLMYIYLKFYYYVFNYIADLFNS